MSVTVSALVAQGAQDPAPHAVRQRVEREVLGFHGLTLTSVDGCRRLHAGLSVSTVITLLSADVARIGSAKGVEPMSVEPLSSLDRSTLRERALESLRSAITSGRYRPATTSARSSSPPTSGSAAARSARRCGISSRKGSSPPATAGCCGSARCPHRGPRAVPGPRGARGPGGHRDHRLAPTRSRGGALRARSPTSRRGDDFARGRGRPRLPPPAVPAVGQLDARRGVAAPRGPDPGRDHER